MSNEAISDQLEKLATSQDDTRNKTARLREVFNDVETAIAAGVPYTKIVETLKVNGLDFTPKRLGAALTKIRRQKIARKQPNARQSKDPRSESGTPKDPPQIDTDNAHKPSALDQIMSSTPDLSALAKLAKRPKK